MPARMGIDTNGDGLLDYPESAAEVPTGPFPVVLRIRNNLCDADSTYAWSVEGEDVGGGKGRCELRWFAEEGTYPVEVEVESAAGDHQSYEREVVVQDWLVVSIGDSVASGEGNPDQPGFFHKAVWQSPRCHRSTLAAPVQAALALERADTHTSVTFVHLACSGAKVRTGLLEPYAGADVPDNAQRPLLTPQVKELEEIAAKRPVDAVVLDAGANDVHFGPLAAFCILHTNCVSQRFDPEAKAGSGEAADLLPVVIRKALAGLRTAYEELGDELKGVVEPSRLLFVEYFDPLRDASGAICNKIGVPFVPHFFIDRNEATFAAEEVLKPLNEEIAEAAQREGWTEVKGVTEAFRQHGYCAGKQSWIRTLTKSVLIQAGNHPASRWLGALHPNELGHRAMASLISAALQRRLYTGEGPAAEPEPEAENPDENEGEGGTGSGAGEFPGLEKDVRNVLLALAALSALGVLGLLRRRMIRSRRHGGGGPPPQIRTDWPGPLHEAATVEAFRYMLEHSNRWVHRRVESIEFIDERRMRRRVSVDFTPRPAPTGPKLVPVAMLSKGVLTHFDLRDEEGASVPMRTADQNAMLSTEYMLAVAEEATNQAPSEQLQQLCWTIARGELPEAELAVSKIKERIDAGDEPEAVLQSKRFRRLTTTFSKSFPIVVALENKRRRVLKYAADEPIQSQPTIKARLGLSPARFAIKIPELGDARSRHIEFLPGEGFEINDASMGGIQPNGEPRITAIDTRDGQTAHLALSNVQRGTKGWSVVRLWAERRGIFVGGPLLAFLGALALTAAWFALPELAENSRDAASLLLAVPAAFVTYIGTRNPHPLAAALMLGVRSLISIAGAAGFIAAGGMALGYSAETLRVILGGGAIVIWLCAACLTVLYFRPDATTA
ncbi:MAG: GDSL-type esterase/lipase family protein [Solirubrobacterales bacterium]